MARVLGLGDEGRRKAFHDAVLAAQGVREGAIVLTHNVADFDRLQQLDVRLRVLFYRT
jgi:predicted nucleic acid-binding protein